MEHRETGIWLFATQKYFPPLIHQPPTLISPGLSPVVFQQRKRVCMCVRVCVLVGARRGWVLPYLLTWSSPTEGKSHSVGVSVLFPWQNLYALCHSTINHATPPEGLAMPPLATKTSTSLTLIYSSYCKKARRRC